jgi:AcrR family transcriptional regulator
LRADALRNRERIIEAARDLFAQRGLDITLDDVAAHAGVGVGTVYRRFASKQELIDGVFEHSVEDLAAHAEQANQNPDPWAAVVDLAEYASTRMAVNRGLTEVIASDDAGRERVACARLRMEPAFAALFARARDAGVIRSDAHPRDFFAGIYMVSSFAEFANPVAPQAWRRYLAIFLDGLRARPDACELPAPPMTAEQVERAKEIQRLHRRG